MLTVFTPTYNRARTLPRLFDSLQTQDCKDFEWLVIDDGSTDGTAGLFQRWTQKDAGFPIRYVYTENGGKQRAVNKGAMLAEGRFFFIVDSDDSLLPDAVSFVLKAFNTLPDDPSFIGISGLRGDAQGRPLGGRPKMGGKPWVDASNLERPRYGLSRDMAEAFFTDKLRNYPFPVWDGEKFTPEAVVWDRMALDGYKLRWFDKVIYRCAYLPGGLTDSTWRLLKENPMGYAMLFNTRLESEKKNGDRLKQILQYVSCCFLAHEHRQIAECHFPGLAFLLSPLAYALSVRRKRQFCRYIYG